MAEVKTATLTEGVASATFHSEQDPVLFEGAYRPGIRAQYYGPLRDQVSMSNVSNQICQSLAARIDGFAVHNYIIGGWADGQLERLSGHNPGAKLGIFYGVPEDVPEAFFRHPIRIGGFVCETDRVDTYWAEVSNRFDFIIVPSKWCRDAFLESGVNVPVLVVPHGLEPEYRPYKEKVRSTPFVFYNTFYATSYCSRKSLEELVRSFLRAFDGRDDVILRLRTDSELMLGELRKRYDFGNLIQVDSDFDCDTETYARIYSDVHCTVHPSKGEGFGMVPFQSLACETPVIALHKTGMADYLTDDNSVRLEPSGRTAGEGVGNAVGTYFSIDEDHLVHCLRHVVENWELEYHKVRQISAEFRSRYQWDNVLSEFNGIVAALLDCESAAHKRAVLDDHFGGPAQGVA